MGIRGVRGVKGVTSVSLLQLLPLLLLLLSVSLPLDQLDQPDAAEVEEDDRDDHHEHRKGVVRGSYEETNHGYSHDGGAPRLLHAFRAQDSHPREEHQDHWELEYRAENGHHLQHKDDKGLRILIENGIRKPVDVA